MRCLAVGCKTIGQIKGDTRVAHECRQYDDGDASAVRDTGNRHAGASCEGRKRNLEPASNDPDYPGG